MVARGWHGDFAVEGGVEGVHIQWDIERGPQEFGGGVVVDASIADGEEGGEPLGGGNLVPREGCGEGVRGDIGELDRDADRTVKLPGLATLGDDGAHHGGPFGVLGAVVGDDFGEGEEGVSPLEQAELGFWEEGAGEDGVSHGVVAAGAEADVVDDDEARVGLGRDRGPDLGEADVGVVEGGLGLGALDGRWILEIQGQLVAEGGSHDGGGSGEGSQDDRADGVEVFLGDTD